MDRDACRALGIDPKGLATGAIVGKATIVGVKRYGGKAEIDADSGSHLVTQGPYSDYRVGYMLADAVRFDRPIPARGWLGFFAPRLRR